MSSHFVFVILARVFSILLPLQRTRFLFHWFSLLFFCFQFYLCSYPSYFFFAFGWFYSSCFLRLELFLNFLDKFYFIYSCTTVNTEVGALIIGLIFFSFPMHAISKISLPLSTGVVLSHTLCYVISSLSFIPMYFSFFPWDFPFDL